LPGSGFSPPPIVPLCAGRRRRLLGVSSCLRSTIRRCRQISSGSQAASTPSILASTTAPAAWRATLIAPNVRGHADAEPQPTRALYRGWSSSADAASVANPQWPGSWGALCALAPAPTRPLRETAGGRGPIERPGWIEGHPVEHWTYDLWIVDESHRGNARLPPASRPRSPAAAEPGARSSCSRTTSSRNPRCARWSSCGIS